MVLLSLASLVLMTVDHRQHHLESIRAALSLLVAPLQYAVDMPITVVNWADHTLASREALVEQNDQLRDEHVKLKAKLQKFAALERENERLRGLLQSSRKVGERVLIGELMAVDMDPFKRQIVINKGSRDGVFEGQPLLDAKGVMGQVIHVSTLTSTAMLITDPGHAIPVQVNRNGLRTIALGTGSAYELDVPHLPNNADVKVGDLLITSGLGQRFPPGYPVATITAVEKDSTQPYARVLARPTAQLERSREVLLVWGAPREETKP